MGRRWITVLLQMFVGGLSLAARDRPVLATIVDLELIGAVVFHLLREIRLVVFGDWLASEAGQDDGAALWAFVLIGGPYLVGLPLLGLAGSRLRMVACRHSFNEKEVVFLGAEKTLAWDTNR